MTATIQKPDPENQSGRHRRRRPVRFSSMESLGFIETPAMVSNTWWGQPSQAPNQTPSASSAARAGKLGAHERTLADLAPNDTTAELIRPRLRWGMMITLTAMVGGLTFLGLWLWQRPAALAEAAAADVAVAAAGLEPELVALDELSQTILAAEVDGAAISAASMAVDNQARALFNAAGTLPAAAGTTRSRAADVATAALDASRLISDSVAYRAAVIQILVPPDLETDPELVGLDQAVRDFGAWQQNFDQVRSALPTGTMSDVSDELELIAGRLEAIQGSYIDGLREDDRLAAKQAVDELDSQLTVAEEMLMASLEDIQAKARDLIEASLAGIDRLLG